MQQKGKDESNLLESFVRVGTPLPSLATSKGDKGGFAPIWEQEVVDEKGRRRFHGAFTGGFSAGYYGTVGSKEGWAPSTFKSSRGSRAGQTTAQAATDLMDEEDLAELASSRTLKTSSAYAPPPSTYDPLLGNIPTGALSDSPALAAADAFASLIEPSTSRIGAQLMRRMGWRDGQGVGPRLTVQQRRKQAAELGIQLEEDLDGDDEDEATKHYFAPLDRPLVTVTEIGIASDRGWGLGYKPGPSIPSSRSTTSRKDMAYGGARLTGEQADDDDVYESEQAVSSGQRKGWGVIDVDDEDDGITLLGMEKKTQKSQAKGKGVTKAPQTFHDGTSVTSGFVVVRDVLAGSSNSGLPPPPPRGWTPNPKRLWDENSPPLNDPKGKGKQLDATERGTLLGEPAPSPIPKSVFDYLSSRDKERLASISQNKPTASTSTTAEPAEPDATLLIPPLDKPTALAALKGFQPYSVNSTSPDPARQARYTLYLQLQAGILPPSTATLPFGPRKLPTGATQTIAELNRELDDYMRAARVFKPVSGMLSGRFTSGGSGGLGPKVEPGLYQPPEKGSGTSFVTATAEEPVVEKLTAAQSAARQGLFGSLTRTVDGFRPGKLVCKRFGVQDPWSGDGGAGDDEPGGGWKEATRTGYGRPAERTGPDEVLGKSSMDALMQSSGFRRLQPEEPTVSQETEWSPPDESGAPSKPGGGSKKEVPTLETVGLGDDERQGEETLTYTKAPKDIFAAIFADSDDEDEDDDEEEEEVPPPAAPAKVGAPVINNTPAEVPTVDETVADVPLSLDNLASYRPTFTFSRAGDDSTSASADAKKRSKKEKKKHKGGTTLSFDVDGEGGEVETLNVKPKKLKKEKEVKEKSRDKAVAPTKDEEEMEWVEVEKAPSFPAAASSLPTPAVASLPPGKRARASDLY